MAWYLANAEGAGFRRRLSRRSPLKLLDSCIIPKEASRGDAENAEESRELEVFLNWLPRRKTTYAGAYGSAGAVDGSPVVSYVQGNRQHLVLP